MAESQNFVLKMTSIAKIPNQVFTSVMSTLVFKAKHKETDQFASITVLKCRVEEILAGIEKLSLRADIVNETSNSECKEVTKTLKDGYMEGVLESMKNASNILRSALKTSNAKETDDIVQGCISMEDAISALEEITITPDEISQPAVSKALMTRAEAPNRFNGYHSRGRRGGRGRRRDRYGRSSFKPLDKWHKKDDRRHQRDHYRSNTSPIYSSNSRDREDEPLRQKARVNEDKRPDKEINEN